MRLDFIGVRIEKSEFYAGKHYTIVAMPAPDAFSFPSKYKLQSDFPLGQPGTFIDCNITMQGIVKNKQIAGNNGAPARSFDDATVLLACTGYQIHQPAQNNPVAANNSTLPEGVHVAGKNK